MRVWTAARAAFALGCVALTGCATIFTGTHDELTFDSNAPHVKLTIDGEYKGELPLKLDMSRNFLGDHHFEAKFEAEGYQTQQFKLDRAFNGVAVLDITSVVTSGGIDLLTGSLMLFSPRDYHVHMVSTGASADSPEYQRSLVATRFALLNALAIQRDLARGGGESLSAFATLLGRDEDGAAKRIEGVSVRNRDVLVGSPDPRAFVRRYGDLLARSPEVSAYGL